LSTLFSGSDRGKHRSSKPSGKFCADADGAAIIIEAIVAVAIMAIRPPIITEVFAFGILSRESEYMYNIKQLYDISKTFY
jgi:hypothetical protein